MIELLKCGIRRRVNLCVHWTDINGVLPVYSIGISWLSVAVLIIQLGEWLQRALYVWQRHLQGAFQIAVDIFLWQKLIYNLYSFSIWMGRQNVFFLSNARSWAQFFFVACSMNKTDCLYFSLKVLSLYEGQSTLIPPNFFVLCHYPTLFALFFCVLCYVFKFFEILLYFKLFAKLQLNTVASNFLWFLEELSSDVCMHWNFFTHNILYANINFNKN